MAPVAAVHTVDAWLDLLAQRPSAVVSRDGAVVVDLGLHNARKHLAIGRQDQWKLGATAHDRTGAVVVGRTASLDRPFLPRRLKAALRSTTPIAVLTASA